MTYPNGTRTVQTFGYSDIPHQIPMNEHVNFPIGSNSKLYTTVAIYQLQEQGKLNVKDDIATMLDHQDFDKMGMYGMTKLCPRLRYHWKCQKITLENLLSMSSGFYPQLNCDVDQTAPGQCNPCPYVISQGSIAMTVGTFLKQPLLFRPGTKYHYSNPNFVLATYFVEKYSGMTFRDYLETNIFSKIGSKNTYFDFYNQMIRLNPNRAGQYVKYYEDYTGELLSVGAAVLELDLGVAAGTGGIVSTVHDQVNFWYALFNKTTLGAPLVLPSSQKAILAPHTLMDQTTLTWNNRTIPIWAYYAQGIVVICTKEKCPQGPRWIQYTGGTFSVETANIMDYSNYAMSQVWTSTVPLFIDKYVLKATENLQTGSFLQFVRDWGRQEVVTELCVQKLFLENGLLEAGLETVSTTAAMS